MAVCVGLAYKCDSCDEISTAIPDGPPWACRICGEETCTHCFHSYGSCSKCCEGKTEEQIIKLFEWEDEDD